MSDMPSPISGKNTTSKPRRTLNQCNNASFTENQNSAQSTSQIVGERQRRKRYSSRLGTGIANNIFLSAYKQPLKANPDSDDCWDGTEADV